MMRELRTINKFDFGLLYPLGFNFYFIFIFVSILIFKFNIFFKLVNKCIVLILCRVDPKMTRLIK